MGMQEAWLIPAIPAGAFAVYLYPKEFSGLIFAIFVITIAAAEVGLALAIVLRIFRNKATANVDEVDVLKW